MNKLVCLVGVLAFAVCVQCEPPEEVKKVFEECAAEVGMTEKPHGPPDYTDEKVKCVHACMMKKFGKLVDGKINLEKELEVMAKHMPNFDDTMKAKVAECVNTANQKSGDCEVAGAMGQCFFEKIGSPPAL